MKITTILKALQPKEAMRGSKGFAFRQFPVANSYPHVVVTHQPCGKQYIIKDLDDGMTFALDHRCRPEDIKPCSI